MVGIIGKAQQLYRLRCKDGVLKSCLPASELELYEGKFKSDGWGDKGITLREAAKLQAPWNTFTGNICKCKPGSCSTKICRCRKNGIDCSSHCHHGESCKNKKYLPNPPSCVAIAELKSPCKSPPCKPPSAVVQFQPSCDPPPAKSQLKPSPLQSCRCRTRCHANKSCPCKKANRPCLSHCHPGHLCANLQSTNQVSLSGGIMVNVEDSKSCKPAKSKPMERWLTIEGKKLTLEHHHIISSGDWLDDSIMDAVQKMLQRQYSHIGGFQSTCLAEKFAMSQPDCKFIQILNVGDNHWLTISIIGCEEGSV